MQRLGEEGLIRWVGGLSIADFTGAMVGVDIKNQGMGQMLTDLSDANVSRASFLRLELDSAIRVCPRSRNDPRGARGERKTLAVNRGLGDVCQL